MRTGIPPMVKENGKKRKKGGMGKGRIGKWE